MDCSNFYASCERVFNPALNGKPIVVLSNNDGCVIARSNEAKALGIKMGVPAYQIKDDIQKYGISVFSSNYTLYGDMSGRVMSILAEQVPEMEVYSIDEAFLNLEGIRDIQSLGTDIINKVIREPAYLLVWVSPQPKHSQRSPINLQRNILLTIVYVSSIQKKSAPRLCSLLKLETSGGSVTGKLPS